jgi:hypothetical protein
MAARQRRRFDGARGSGRYLINFAFDDSESGGGETYLAASLLKSASRESSKRFAAEATLIK